MHWSAAVNCRRLVIVMLGAVALDSRDRKQLKHARLPPGQHGNAQLLWLVRTTYSRSPCAIAALNASAHVSARQATQRKSPLARDVARAVLRYSPCTCIATGVRVWTATSAYCAKAWHGCRRLKEQRGRARGVEHAARKCGGASSTQKRALSYAAALCGSTVHRDRAGMNPSARGG